MDIAIKKAFAQLLFWLLDFLDSIFQMFQVLCGIQPVKVDGEENSIIGIFLNSSVVTKAFLMIFLVSIAVCALSIIVTVVKNIINLKGGERKSHAKTVGQGFGSIIVSSVMAVIMIVGISGSNIILSNVYTATVGEQKFPSISHLIFDMCVTQVEVDDLSKKPTYIEEKDDKGNIIYEVDPEGNPVVDKNGNKIPKYVLNEDGSRLAIYPKTFVSSWKNDANVNGIDFSKTSVDSVFGVRKKSFGFEQSDKKYMPGQEGMLELNGFNFWVAYFVTIMMLIALIWSMLGLVKRIFDLVALFIMLPLISATIPLDDGARLKVWRETVISKVLLAYGAVISVNIFLIIVPIITDITLGEVNSFYTIIFRMFMLIGGALSINGGQLLIARLFGTSADESREMAQSARALIGGTVAAGGMAHSVKNAVLGGTNKGGGRTTGAVPMLGKSALGVANVVGNTLGGNAYRGLVSRIKGGAKGVDNVLRGMTKSGNTTDKASSPIGDLLKGNKMPADVGGAKQSTLHNGLLGAVYDKQAKTAADSRMLDGRQGPLGRTVTNLLERSPLNKKENNNRLLNVPKGVMKNKNSAFKQPKRK